jgi:ATP-binding cassette subfamily C protein LapB
MVARHPQGLDLQIAEGGRGLSGGQRCLTTLARLSLAEPDIWLLDEPTSNLDQASEMRVLQHLQNTLMKGKTAVIVTHRMQILPLTSRLIVMNNGKIVMDGPTPEVMAKLRTQSEKPSVKLAAAKSS